MTDSLDASASTPPCLSLRIIFLNLSYTSLPPIIPQVPFKSLRIASTRPDESTDPGPTSPSILTNFKSLRIASTQPDESTDPGPTSPPILTRPSRLRSSLPAPHPTPRPPIRPSSWMDRDTWAAYGNPDINQYYGKVSLKDFRSHFVNRSLFASLASFVLSLRFASLATFVPSFLHSPGRGWGW